MGTLKSARAVEVDTEMARKKHRADVEEGAARGRGDHVTLQMMQVQQEGQGMTADGQSESSMRTKQALVNKMPKFFAWVRSLDENHKFVEVKTMIPTDDNWKNIEPDHMTDRRYAPILSCYMCLVK